MVYEQSRIVNLYPVNDVYAVYEEDDGSYSADKVPFLGLCEDGQIIPLSYSYELSPCCDAINFQAYGTKESLEAEFHRAKIDFQGDAAKPVYQDNTSDCPHTAPYCPECGHILMDGNGDNFNYCPDCGQKIDWREAK